MSELSTPTILIIDDNDIFRQSLVMYCKDLGWIPAEASDGQAGLERFHETRPDVVLVDLRLPLLDGLEVLKRIKAESPDTPVIAISGAGSLDDSVVALRYGAMDFILKPIGDYAILEKAIVNALDHIRLVNENRMYQQQQEEKIRERTQELEKANRSLQTEIVERRKIADESIRRQKYLDGITAGTRLLLASRDNIPHLEFLKHIGSMADACRAYIILFNEKTNGERVTRQIAQWQASTPEPVPPFDGLHDILLEKELKYWEPKLSTGNTVYGEVAAFPMPLRKRFKASGTISFLAIPMIIEEKLLGMVCLDNCQSPTAWSEVEQNYIRIAADNLGQELRRTRIKEQLADERNLLRSLIDNLPDHVYVKDADGRYLATNSSNLRMLGLKSEAEIIGKNVFDLFPEDTAKTLNDEDSAIINSGIPVLNREELMLNRNNVQCWYSTTKIPLYHQGVISGLVGISTDITERRRAEEELHRHKNLLEAIFTSTPDFLILKDANYTYQAVNPAFCDFIGKTQQQIIGKTDFDLFPKEEAELFRDNDKAVLRTAQSRSDDEITTGNAGKSWLNVTKTPIIDAEGNATGILCSARNISERKAAELERERLIAELEAKNTELERFTHTVSHDLKSPLHTVRGFAKRLAKDIEAGRQDRVEEEADAIQRATDRMLRLLDELLRLCRAGLLANLSEKVSLATLADEAVELVGERLAEQEATVDISPSLPTVSGDPIRLLEVFQNLIDNALKFSTGREKPHINIETRQDNGKQVICVRDNGKGIEPEMREQVFAMFHQVDPFLEGTGIGLAIVKRIIEAHNGSIWVESEGTGRGTTFCFTLGDQQQPEKTQYSSAESALIH